MDSYKQEVAISHILTSLRIILDAARIDATKEREEADTELEDFLRGFASGKLCRDLSIADQLSTLIDRYEGMIQS